MDWVDAPNPEQDPPTATDDTPTPPEPDQDLQAERPLNRLRWQLILLGVGLVLIAVAGLFFVLQSAPAPVEAPPEVALTESEAYTEALVGEPQFVNPLLAGSQVDRDLASLVFSGLTRVDQYGQPVPDLAEGWTVSRDGLTYVFTLRPDATWHDGEPVTAEDVAFTFELLRDPDFPGAPALARFWQTVEVYADDTFTVRFVLTQPLSAFPEYAGVGILPQHWLQGVDAADLPDDAFNLDPIGSGPLDWVSITAEEGLTTVSLQPYDGYYDDERAISLDAVRFTFYDEAGEAFAALGPEVMAYGGLSAGQLEAVLGSPQLSVYSSRMPAYGAVIFNQGTEALPFFQEEEVRTALALALDRAALLSESRMVTLTNSPVLPGTWAYNPNAPIIGFEPEIAAQQLNTAGWVEEGNTRARDGVRMRFTLLAPDQPFERALAQAIRAQWRELGVDVTVETVDPAELVIRLQERDFDAALVEFSNGGVADPDPYAFWHQSQIDTGQNFSAFSDRDISEALETIRRDPNGVRRAELYREFQRWFIERGAAVLLYNPVYHYAVSCQVTGVQNVILAEPSDRFNTMHTWEIAEGAALEEACP